MRRIVVTAAGCLVLSAPCHADSFQLKSDADGKTYGPYEFVDGAKVVIGAASFTLVKPDEAESALKKKLKSITVPKLNFKKANITDVLDHLRQVSLDRDAADTPAALKGVNFILKSDPKEMPEITLNLQNVSMLDALNYITELANLTYRTDDNAVVIEPRK